MVNCVTCASRYRLICTELVPKFLHALVPKCSLGAVIFDWLSLGWREVTARPSYYRRQPKLLHSRLSL